MFADRSYRAAGVILALVLWTTPAWSAAPKTPKPKTNPAVKTTTATTKAAAAQDRQLIVPEAKLLLALQNRDDTVVLPPGMPRFLAAGTQVFDIQERKATGKSADKLKKTSAKRALSPDGRYFAYEADADYVNYLEVLDCQTGEVKHKLRFTEEKFKTLAELTFTRFGNLVAVGQVGSQSAVFVWELKEGKLVKKVPLDTAAREGQVAVNATGQLAAVASTEKLQIYDVVKGTVTASLKRPSGEGHIFLFVSGLAFSPDSKEVAAMISTGGGYRLVAWSLEGEVLEEIPLGLQASTSARGGANLLYTPQQDGWLVHGDYLLDRKSKKLVWVLRPPVQHRYPHAFLDADHLLTSRGDFTTRELVSVKVPYAEIRTAAETLASGQGVLLKPGDEVTVTVEVGEARFSDKDKVAEALHEVLSGRLSELGMNLVPEAPVTLYAKYSEASGEKLRVLQGGPFGRDTGQTVQETVTVLELKMLRKGTRAPIWEKTERKGNPHILHGKEVSDQAIRDQTFKMVNFMIQTMTIPYFIPADPKAPRLPLITQL